MTNAVLNKGGFHSVSNNSPKNSFMYVVKLICDSNYVVLLSSVEFFKN